MRTVDNQILTALHQIRDAIKNKECCCNKDEQEGGGESNSIFKHYPIAFIDLNSWNDSWNGEGSNLAAFKNDIKDINLLLEYIKNADDVSYIMFLYSKDTTFNDDEFILRGLSSKNKIWFKYKNDGQSTNIRSCSLQDGEDTYVCDYDYD